MTGPPTLENYIDVAERIALFKDKYPNGSLQTISWSIEQVGDKTFIVYRAAAYREPDDKRPGHGTAWEPFPGPTAFTKNSELMNAETAAWGRAIVACGLVANRSIASRQEVQARQAETNGGEKPQQRQPTAAPVEPTERIASAKQRGLINARAGAAQLLPSLLANIVLVATGNEPREWSSEEAAQEWLKRGLDRLPASAVDKVLENIAAEAGVEA